jgi:hypothetical protein
VNVPQLTTEQRRVLEELGIERLKMRLDPNATGIGAGASVFGLKPDVTRLQAEQWLVEELLAERRREEEQKGETLRLARLANEQQTEALRWTKFSGKWALIAGITGIVAVIVTVLQWLLGK